MTLRGKCTMQSSLKEGHRKLSKFRNTLFFFYFVCIIINTTAVNDDKIKSGETKRKINVSLLLSYCYTYHYFMET